MVESGKWRVESVGTKLQGESSRNQIKNLDSYFSFGF